MNDAIRTAYQQGFQVGTQAAKTLDVGAAIQRLEEIQDGFFDVMIEYQNLSKAVLSTYSRPGFDLSSVLDRDWMDKLDQPRLAINNDYEKLSGDMDKFITALREVSDATAAQMGEV